MNNRVRKIGFLYFQPISMQRNQAEWKAGTMFWKAKNTFRLKMERFPLYLLLLLLPCLQASDCPDEWYDTGSPDLGCLFFGDKPKTWVEAHEACEDNIGHMAEATTLEQVLCVTNIANSPIWPTNSQQILLYTHHDTSSKFQANEIYTLAKIIGDIRGKKSKLRFFHQIMMTIVLLMIIILIEIVAGVKRWWLGLTDIIKWLFYISINLSLILAVEFIDWLEGPNF